MTDACTVKRTVLVSEDDAEIPAMIVVARGDRVSLRALLEVVGSFYSPAPARVRTGKPQARGMS